MPTVTATTLAPIVRLDEPILRMEANPLVPMEKPFLMEEPKRLASSSLGAVLARRASPSSAAGPDACGRHPSKHRLTLLSHQKSAAQVGFQVGFQVVFGLFDSKPQHATGLRAFPGKGVFGPTLTAAFPSTCAPGERSRP